MAARPISLRLDPDLIEWADAYAAKRKSTRTKVIAAALAEFREACGGPRVGRLPDLQPPVDTPRPSPAGRKAKSKVARGPARPAATASQGASRPTAGDRPLTVEEIAKMSRSEYLQLTIRRARVLREARREDQG